MHPLPQGASRKARSRLSEAFYLLVSLLVVLPFSVAAQDAEPLDLIYRGEFDELGWEKSDLLHVAVVLHVRGGCQIDQARADEFDAPGFVSAWERLVAQDPDLALAGIGSALHPAARRLLFWLEEAGATECSHDVWQRLLLNAARYVIAYEANQPTDAEVVEAQTDAWWAKLSTVRVAEEDAQWHEAGWVAHEVGRDLTLENRDEVLHSLAAALESLAPEQLKQCQSLRLRALIDEGGRVDEVFGREEASGYSAFNSDSRAQSYWEGIQERCAPLLPIAKEAVQAMELRPARTPEGLDVPAWLRVYVGWYPFGVTLKTHAWAWRLRDGQVLPGDPFPLRPHRYKSGDRPPVAVQANRQEPAAVSADVERLKAEGPTFTPYTAAPQIENPDAVEQAVERHYPPMLREGAVGGSVPVWVLVDAQGGVADVRLVSSSGHAALDNAALQVARVMQFTPATNQNTPTPVWVKRSVVFSP